MEGRVPPPRNLGAISESSRVRSHNDQIIGGIWSHMPTEFSIMLWRIIWGYLTIFQRLREWEIQTKMTSLNATHMMNLEPSYFQLHLL